MQHLSKLPHPSEREINLSSFLSEAALSYPDYIDAISAWTEHVPFAFWLIQALGPDCFVELGTHSGVSYLAFCQAIKALALPTHAYAIDTWRGDEHSGYYGEEVFDKLRGAHDPRYSSFSRLVRTTFDEAAGHFSDDSIDLLHIDGLHTYEAVKHDFETWGPKLAPRSTSSCTAMALVCWALALVFRPRLQTFSRQRTTLGRQNIFEICSRGWVDT